MRWSTNDTGYKLQLSPLLPPATGWLTSPFLVQTNGDKFELHQSNGGDSSRFYRLLQPGNSTPTLTLLNPPTGLMAGTRTNLNFSYADADGDLLLLELVRIQGTTTNRSILPASLIGLGGTTGSHTLSLDGRELPFGAHEWQLRLHDSLGNTSSWVAFTLQVTGVTSGGTAPALTLITAGEPASFTRPSGLLNRTRPPMPVTYSDPDGDLFRVRIKTIAPGNVTNVIEESASALGMSGISGTVRPAFFTFVSSNLFGAYTVELTGIDRNGNVGATTARTVQLSSFSFAAPGLALMSFSPPTGPAGTPVILNGGSFDPVLSNNVVELNGLNVPVLALTNTSLGLPVSLLVRIPDGAETGPFIVRKPPGVAAITSTMFVVPPSVKVVTTSDPGTNEFTEAFSVRPGGRMQLDVEVVPLTQGGDRSVDWLVEGIVGGNATVGTVSASGLFTAPPVAPVGGNVTVSAALRSSPTVTGSLALEVAAQEPLPGEPKLIQPAVGGVVHSKDWRASVAIPAGALSEATSIAVREAALPLLPPPGNRLLGAAEFLPSGTVFGVPATVTIPLRQSRPAGTTLALLIYVPGVGNYVDEGIQAVVIEPGDRAIANLPHFTTVVVAEGITVPSGPAPSIATIDPNSVREGDLIPVKLTGIGLSADLQAEFLNGDGSPATDLAVVTFVGRDDEAGVLVEVGSIPNFDGGSRTYRLRLSRSDGAAAEINFAVEGLPELIVGAGQEAVFDNPAPLVVSGVRVEAGGLIRVRSGKLDIESTGDVVIHGRIDAAGKPGGSAGGQQAGQPAELGHGGRGGMGREDSEGFLGLDGAEPINYGRNGNDAMGYSRPEQGPSRPLDPREQRPQGIGGPAGANLELDPLGLVAKLVECIGSGGIACIQTAISLAEQVRSVVNIIDGGGPGRRGYGAVSESILDETGGGGGGGGGMIEITLNIADLLDALNLNIDVALFDYVGVRFSGGGGGAGGDGGRDIAIRTRRTVVLGETGEISVAGGDGGAGSSESTMVVNTSEFNFTVGTNLPALPGGGGGGGRGGVLTLNGGLGIQRSSPDQLNTRGGSGGNGGVPFLDSEDRVSRWHMAAAADANGPAGRRFVNGPLLDPASYRPTVTSRQLLTLQGVTVMQAGTPTGIQPVPVQVRVQGSLPGEDRTYQIPFDPGVQRYRGNVLLYRGWNRVSGPRLIAQTMLVISVDSDDDGLSDDDEADLGTDPNLADTDGDGLEDGEEMVSGGNPLRADTDGDGLRDGAEFALGTALNRADTDGDGAWDSAEVFFATDPKSAASKPLEVFPGVLLSSATHPETAGGAHLAAFNGTGQFGLLGRPAGGFGHGLAADRNGDLFIADGTRLTIYDPLGRVAVDVGEFAPGGTIQCATLTFNPADGFLYGVELGGAPSFANTGQLLRIDRATGAAIRVGLSQAQAIRALACDAAGKLFAILASGPSDLLVSLDSSSGALTQTVGSVGFAPVTGLAFDPAGNLFAVAPIDEASSRVLTVNPVNGVASQVTIVQRSLSGLVVMPCPAPCFNFAGASAGWFLPTKLRSADFDGDGMDDLVLLAARDSSLTRSSVTFFRSNSNGLFSTTVNHPLTSPPNTITGDELAIADLNGDAAPEVIAKNVFDTPASAAVFLNAGNAVFPAPGYFPTVIDPKSIAVGNLDGNTFTDFAVVGDGVLLVYSGERLGSFGVPTQPIALDPNWFLLDVRLGDVDGDGDLDLVLLDSAALIVSLNDGAGGFAQPVVKSITYEDNGVELADVNGDGLADVITVITSSEGGFYTYLSLNNGQMSDPVFTSFASGKLDSLVQDFVLGDLNEDGLPDLVFAEYLGNAIHIWLSQGDGSFTPRKKGPLFTPTNQPPLTVTLGDFNGDGKPDVAAGVLVLNQIWTWLKE